MGLGPDGNYVTGILDHTVNLLDDWQPGSPLPIGGTAGYRRVLSRYFGAAYADAFRFPGSVSPQGHTGETRFFNYLALRGAFLAGELGAAEDFTGEPSPMEELDLAMTTPKGVGLYRFAPHQDVVLLPAERDALNPATPFVVNFPKYRNTPETCPRFYVADFPFQAGPRMYYEYSQWHAGAPLFDAAYPESARAALSADGSGVDETAVETARMEMLDGKLTRILAILHREFA
jgi:hypothetical protein